MSSEANTQPRNPEERRLLPASENLVPPIPCQSPGEKWAQCPRGSLSRLLRRLVGLSIPPDYRVSEAFESRSCRRTVRHKARYEQRSGLLISPSASASTSTYHLGR